MKIEQVIRVAAENAARKEALRLTVNLAALLASHARSSPEGVAVLQQCRAAAQTWRGEALASIAPSMGGGEAAARSGNEALRAVVDDLHAALSNALRS